MWFGQCDFIDGLMPDAIGDLHSSLGTVSLEACFSLVTLPDAFTRLKKLVSLDLSHCSRLAALPDAFGSLSSLIVLEVRGCSSLATLPDSFVRLSSLQKLDMRRCSSLVALPEALGSLAALVFLDLDGCREIKALPESIGDLQSLGRLALAGCKSLTALPDSLCGLVSLEKVSVGDCPKLSLPTAVDKMPGLALYGGDVPPRISSTSAFALAAASNRIRRRWASRRCLDCGKQVAETHPRFRCCGACREVFYCSVGCQRKSWECGHRGACSTFRRRRRRMCDVCGRQCSFAEPPYPVCGGCDARRYCGEACQIADWEAGHARKCG